MSELRGRTGLMMNCVYLNVNIISGFEIYMVERRPLF